MRARAATLFTAFAALLALAAISGEVRAEYPDKPIRLVVPWPARGGSDVVAPGRGAATPNLQLID